MIEDDVPNDPPGGGAIMPIMGHILTGRPT